MKKILTILAMAGTITISMAFSTACDIRLSSDTAENTAVETEKPSSTETENEELPSADEFFIHITKRGITGPNYYLVYNRYTKIIYIVSDGVDNKGSFTEMRHKDGSLVTYDEWKEMTENEQ